MLRIHNREQDDHVLPAVDHFADPCANSISAAALTPRMLTVKLRQRRLQQQQAPLPELYSEHPRGESGGGDRVRTGVGEVIDGGQDVIVLFSVVNPQHRNILLMPPQVQLGGKTKQGKLIKQSRWTTAEQLPVMDYRLSKRRLAPGERADGVIVFERPPFKQSNETLFLQMAEAGAVDHPALAPIGFGISTTEENNHGRRGTGQ